MSTSNQSSYSELFQATGLLSSRLKALDLGRVAEFPVPNQPQPTGRVSHDERRSLPLRHTNDTQSESDRTDGVRQDDCADSQNDIQCQTELDFSFIRRLPAELSLPVIWARVIADCQTGAAKFRTIATFRSVCAEWRLWVECTPEFRDYWESWVDNQAHEDFARGNFGYFI